MTRSLMVHFGNAVVAFMAVNANVNNFALNYSVEGRYDDGFKWWLTSSGSDEYAALWVTEESSDGWIFIEFWWLTNFPGTQKLEPYTNSSEDHSGSSRHVNAQQHQRKLIHSVWVWMRIQSIQSELWVRSRLNDVMFQSYHLLGGKAKVVLHFKDLTKFSSQWGSEIGALMRRNIIREIKPWYPLSDKGLCGYFCFGIGKKNGFPP